MISTTERKRLAGRGRGFLRWTQGLFLIVGILALSYVAVTLLHARFYQEVANNTLDRQMRSEVQHNAGLPRAAVKEGDVLGRIEIPRLGMSVAILEGTTSRRCGLVRDISKGPRFPESRVTLESQGTAIHTFAS